MKLRSLMCIALLTVAAPCYGQNALFSSEERLQGEASVQSAAAYFAHSLREPSSAAFRNVFIRKRPLPTKTLKVIVCGEVNGKNGYGDFTGFQYFIVSGDEVHIGKETGFESVYEACHTDRVFDTKDYSGELSSALIANR